MLRLYLLPLEHVGNARGPRYLKWRFGPGLDSRWSLKDFGARSAIALVATDAQLPAFEVCRAWSIRERDRLRGALRDDGIESAWIMQASDWRETWQRLAGLTQAYQSSTDHNPERWLGRDIYCGFATLRHLDERRYAAEQESQKARVIEQLCVRWSISKPSFDWRSALRQMMLMPLWMLLGALPATDSFTGTNGTALQTYSNSWTINTGAFAIQSNAVAPNSVSYIENGAHWNADTFGDAQYAQGTFITSGSSDRGIGVAVRAADSGATYYGFYGDSYTSSKASYVFKNVAGVFQQLGSNGTAFANNDLIRLEVSGTTLTPKVNGNNSGIGAQTDSSIASGYAGISGWSNTTSNRIDDWEGGNLAIAVSATDSGTLSESSAIAADVPATDSATLGEASVVELDASDSATLTEGEISLTADVPATDSATLGEESNLNTGSAISGADSVILSESSAIAADVPATDSATLGEETTALDATLSSTDGGTLSETTEMQVGQFVTVSDSGTLSESSVIEAALSSTDSATLGDAASISTGTSDHAVSVGNGYTDVTPRQIVRTKANRLYVSSWKFDDYPWGGFGANYNEQTLRMYKADQNGVPATFTRLDQAHEPVGVVSWSMAIDGNDVIHVLWAVRATYVDGHPHMWDGTENYLCYSQFDTATDMWGAVENIETAMATTDRGQDDELVAIAIDGNNVPHIVYLKHDGTRRRVTYRNRSNGTWSNATTVDDQSFATDERCWHPGIVFDYADRIVVTWIRGTHEATTTGRTFVRVYSSGVWSTTHDVAGASVWCGIDTGTPLYIDPSGRYHVCYINTSKQVQYRYSDDQGATWTANHPASGAWLGDDPTPGPGPSGKVRIYAHGLAADNYPIVYWEGDGGSAAWGTTTTYSNTATPNDCSVNVRWTQYWCWHPSTRDIAFWQSNYPTNALYVGTDIDATDCYGTDSATLSESSSILKSATGNDSGTLGESSSIAATLARTDGATLAEGTSLIAATAVPGTDSATLTESSAIAATLARADSATFTESSAIAAALARTDNATLSELSQLNIFTFADVSGSDSATLTEGDSSLVVTITSTDAFTLTDASALAADLPAGTDGATLSESTQINTGEAPQSSDLFMLSEASTMTIVLAAADAFALAETSSSLTAVLSRSDSFLLSDATAAITVGGVIRDTLALTLSLDRAREFDLAIDRAHPFDLEL